MSDDTLAPLVSPALLAKAREEIDAMVTGIVPEGKRGAVVGIFDASGIRIGGAAKVLGDDLVVDVSVLQQWKRTQPGVQVRVKWTF
jgi:hypothetical protein